VLETLTLSILNFDSGVATKRCASFRAAEGRRLIEMGSRRTNERAAVAAARASYIAGFDATSNLAAGMLYDIPRPAPPRTPSYWPTRANVRLRGAGRDAGPSTTLLVDTFDTEAAPNWPLTSPVRPGRDSYRYSGVIADAALRSRNCWTSAVRRVSGSRSPATSTNLLSRTCWPATFRSTRSGSERNS